MTAKIVIEAMERSLPTSVAYRSDRITSFKVEYDGEDGAAFGPHGVPKPEDLARIHAAQLADLDAQEAALRARYDMPVPRPSPIAQPGGDFQTADKVHASTPVGAPPAQAGRSTPPPSAMRDVSDGMADELRRLGGRIMALGGSIDEAMPATEADAQAMLPLLRSRLFDLQQKANAAPKPGLAQPASQSAFVGGPSPAAQVKPADRKCSDPAHPARTPRFITSREFDAGLAAHGAPLCDAHMQARRQGGKQ